MKHVQLYLTPSSKVFSSSAVSAAIHVFGALTCSTCWAIFGPALALLFGSGGIALLGFFRPYAPVAVGLSAIGLSYSIYQLVQNRGSAKGLPYRMAALFTILSAIGWTGSAAYTLVTVMKG